MNRPGFEYTVPASTYYPSNSRPPQYAGYGQHAHSAIYSPSSHPLSNYADVYEGNNDTTLRAEERHWYIENHKNIQSSYTPPNHETSIQDAKIKKEEEKKPEVAIRRTDTEARQRRKEDRCSCECWPTTENNAIQDSTVNRTSRSLSGVDMVASYGVYGNPQDDDAGFARISEKGAVYGQSSDAPTQGVIVNQQGNSAIVRSTSSSDGVCGKCCVWSSSAPATNSEDFCWNHYCKPALIILIIVFTVVLLGILIVILLTNNCKYLLYFLDLVSM